MPSINSTVNSRVRATHGASRLFGPSNVLVLYRSGDPVGQAMASYYKTVRNIPAANVQSVTMTWTPNNNPVLTPGNGGQTYSQITQADMTSVLGQIVAFLRANDILSIVTCHFWPTFAGASGLSVPDCFRNPYFWYNASMAGRAWDNTIGAVAATYCGNAGQLQGAGHWTSGGLADNVFHPLSVNSTGVPIIKGRYANITSTRGMPEGQVAFVPFRLEASPTPLTDPIFGDPVYGPMANNYDGAGGVSGEYAYVRRQIDYAISAEGKKYRDFGTVLLQGAGSSLNKPAAYWGKREIDIFNIPTRLQLYQGLGSEPSGAANQPDIYGTDVMPSGYSDLRPIRNGVGYKVWNPLDFQDVFLKWGNGYYGGTNLGAMTEMVKPGDYGYRVGAIVGHWGSYSGSFCSMDAIDYDFDLVTAYPGATGFTPNVDIACTPAYTSIPFRCVKTYSGLGQSIWRNQYSVAYNIINSVDVNAKINLSSAGFLSLKSGPTVLVTLDLSASQSPRAFMAALITACTTAGANWQVAPGNSGFIGYAHQEVKLGATISMGSVTEPLTSGSLHCSDIVANLWSGLSVQESVGVMYSFSQPLSLGFPGASSGQENVVWGDPLYRPFGHRL